MADPTPTIDRSDLASWIRARSDGRVRSLIGIVGPPGSGKSTLATTLAADLDAPVVPMDGFHLPNVVLDERGLRAVKGAPATFAVTAFVDTVRRLRDGLPVSAPDFDRITDEPRADRIVVSPDQRIVIVEGNYLLLDEPPWNELRDLLDDVAYLDVDGDVRRARLVDRHVRFGRLVAEAERFVADSDERNTALIERARGRATLFVGDRSTTDVSPPTSPI